MGYTHYWRRPPKLDAAKFKAWVEDVKIIVDNAIANNILLCGDRADHGHDCPITNKDEVQFNGIGDEAHETFAIDREFKAPEWRRNPDQDGLHFDFCKTARKRYDLPVCACLIRFKRHFGEAVEVSSDGSDDPDEWGQALGLCNELFGTSAMPFSEEE